MGKLVDNIIAFKLLKMIVTPFNETQAFKLGIIDEEGKVLKKSYKLKTVEEQDAYNYLTRLIFNIKRMINRLGGESKLKSLAAALFLFKEHNESEDESVLTEQYVDVLGASYLTIMEDENFDLDTYIEIVEKFLEEEGMVTVDALPKGDAGETTPAISKKKKFKVMRREITVSGEQK